MYFKRNLTHCFLILVLVGFCFSCLNEKGEDEFELPFYNEPTWTAIWTGDKISHKIDSFGFVNQHGRLISNKEMNGKVSVANFFFSTCPTICPKMFENLQTIEQEFLNDSVLIFSHTVTPWMDSVARLKAYAEQVGIKSTNWHLLTGSQKELYEIARTSYFAEKEIGYSKDSSQFLHTEHFVLVDQKGKLRGVYNGTSELETARMKTDIHWLLMNK